MRFIFSFLLITIASSAFAQTNEPAYCSHEGLYKHNRIYFDLRLKRHHVFKLGKVKVVGLALGNRQEDAVINMVENLSSGIGEEQKYCAFYFNQNRPRAEELFNHFPMPNPGSQSIEETVEIFGGGLQSLMAQENNYVTCAEKGLIVIGCNAQKHRGPTAFGMMLAYSGCTPETAAATVNKIWGLNGVPPEHRLAAIRRGFEMGQADPEKSARLRELFLAE